MISSSKRDDNFAVGIPMCDWLTLGTFDDEVMKAFVDYLHEIAFRLDIEPTDSKVMQYEGIRAESVFYGAAIQDERIHGLLSIGGQDAHSAVFADFDVNQASPKCTRIDLQITMPLESDFDSYRLSKQLQDGRWKRRGSDPMVDVYLSGAGYDTIYVGARSSDRFWRIYVKGSPEEKYLRFEVEYKSQRAEMVLAKVKADWSAFSGILANEWHNAPNVDDLSWNAIGRALDAFGTDTQVVVPRSFVTTDKTFRWMIKCLLPVLKRMLNDHYYGQRTREELEILLN